ncbi:DUF6232 family protein [Sphingosinithalassobacter portus]|uniref:DUF6232 family protein n=1 Tax=Stakelama portus TaxID=2676234 RepID=UPI000D6E9B69|nr:DUF6232 family protein [Sphingosinithalassobacter portus]
MMTEVQIDENFARFGSKTYAINKINSVDTRTTMKSGSKAWIFWWGLAAIVLISRFGGGNVSAGGATAVVVFAALLGWLGWRSFRKRFSTTYYHLYLMTSSSEAQAYVTTDESEMAELRAKIEDAMARAG